MQTNAIGYTDVSSIESAMKLVATFIAENPKCRIVWNNRNNVSADIHSGVINIPRIGFVTPEALMKLRVFVYHEGGHIAKTKLEKKDTPKKPLFDILNAVEDHRMEAALSKEYEGCRAVFDWGCDYFNKEIGGKVQSGEAKNAALWEALGACRFVCLGKALAWALTPKAQKYFDVALPIFRKVDGARNTVDSLAIAVEIYEALKEMMKEDREQQKKEQEKQQQKQQKQNKKNEKKEDSENGEQSEASDEEDGEGASGEESEDSEEDSGKGSAGDESGEDSDEDSKEEDGEGSSGDDSEDSEKDGEGSAGDDSEDSDEDSDEDSGEGSGSGDDEESEDEDSENGSGDSDDSEEDSKEDSKEGKGDSKGDSKNDDSEDDGAEAGKDSDSESGNDSGSDNDSDSDSKNADGDNEKPYKPENAKDSKKAKSKEEIQKELEEQKKQEAEIEKELEEDAAGQTFEKSLADDIKKLLEALPPQDTEYTAMRENDKFEIPDTTIDDKVRYNEKRNRVSSAIMSMSRALDQALRSMSRVRKNSYLEHGRIDMRRLTVIAKSMSKKVFFEKKDGEALNTAVSIVIDESGSMSNCYLQMQLLALALGETLDKIGVPFEILGASTMSYSFDMPALEGFTRTNPIRWKIYKVFNENWNAVKERITHVHHYNNHIDGEVVQFAASRLATRPERRKVILSLSDGEPCGGQGNDADMAANLIRVCERCRKSGIEVYGFGVQTTTPKAFYGEKHFIYLESAETMSQEFFVNLANIVTQGKVKL